MRSFVVTCAKLFSTLATTLAFRVEHRRYTWRSVSGSHSLLYDASSSNMRDVDVSVQNATGGRVSAFVTQSTKKKIPSSKEKVDLNPPKGTRDFYPEDQRLKQYLFGEWRAVASLYAFDEYDAPVLESEDLYIRKSGDEVTQQLYNFEDKGGRRVSLRPEMTPSLARMVLAKKGGLPFPLKWYSIPQCWRYERMTRGRRREHYQWNMDVWGVAGVEAEVELISILVTSLERFGITSKEVGIKINSRKILTDLMKSYGIPEAVWGPTLILIDKLEKVPIDSMLNDLDALGLQETVVRELLQTLHSKDLETFEKLLGVHSEGVSDLKRIFELCDSYGCRDWLVFDPSVVRGLSYYTGVVFEGFDRKGELRAIFGGGRYDKLLESMSGGTDTIPAVGFGFGDAVIVELLSELKLLPDFARGTVEVVIFASDALLRPHAMRIAKLLRASGLFVDLILEDKKAKWVFQKADKIKAASVVVVSSNTAGEGVSVAVKCMTSGEQSLFKVDENEKIVDVVKGMVNK